MTTTTLARIARRSTIGLILLLSGWAGSASAASETVRFGVEAWPGLTVKSEVASELLQALGYKTEQKNLNTPFVVRGLTQGNIDVALGLWEPLTSGLVDPLVKQGKIIKLTANLQHALSGLAVPAYVHRAGVNTVADLNRHADRFDHKIYGIEAGSTYDQYVNDAIKQNTYDLGGWHLVASSVAAMLAEVQHSTARKQWIVFYGWRPHWMNVVYNLYYLKLPKGVSHQAHPIVDAKASVYTVVPAEFPEKHPNLTRFFKQFRISTHTQSEWIYEFGHQKKSKDEVARHWIDTHPARVREILQGVKTTAGQPGFKAVRHAFDMKPTR